jgi:hypothetical protein
MIKSKPIASFGYVSFLCKAEKLDKHNVPLGKSGEYVPGIYFIVNGEQTLVVNNNIVGVRKAGDLNTGLGNTYPNSMLHIDHSNNSEWLCIPRNHNGGKLPIVTGIVIKKGESYPAINGKNLLLVKGNCTVNGIMFEGAKQIRVRSGDVRIDAIEDCYILDFI